MRLRIVRRESHRPLRIVHRRVAELQFLTGLRGITHQVPILPRDAHQESDVIRIQLFRRKIKLQRLGGLQFGVKDIALLDQFLRRFRTYPRARESQQSRCRESVEEKGGIASCCKVENIGIHCKLETARQADFMVPRGFPHSFFDRSFHQPARVEELRLAQPRPDQLQARHGHLGILQGNRQRQRRVAREIHGHRILPCRA